MDRVERVAILLSVVLPFLPQSLEMALNYFHASPSLFGRIGRENTKCEAEEEVVKAGWRLLRFNRQEFCKIWDWSPLFSLLLSSSNRTLRYFASQCVSILLSLSPNASLSMNRNVLSKNTHFAVRLHSSLYLHSHFCCRSGAEHENLIANNALLFQDREDGAVNKIDSTLCRFSTLSCSTF